MKVMVVDDSIVFRSGISRALGEVDGIDVVKSASNGKIAVEFLKQEGGIDLITLDLEMPVMDGIEAIKEIRKFNSDIKIVVFSALSTRGAEQTIEALTAGANDFVTKVQADEGASIEDSLELIRDKLIPKLQALVFPGLEPTQISHKNSKVVELNQEVTKALPLTEKYSSGNYFEEMPLKPKLILIGCSTGGPDALRTIFKNLKHTPTVPILIVQHMPPIFTEKLAKSLDNESRAIVREATDGESLMAGTVYIAPGDFHMCLNKDNKIQMDQSEKECFVRPCVNKLFESVADNYVGQVLSIVLTGMGEDGARGVSLLKNKKSYVYIQDKGTSAVWGMPGAVFKKNINALSLRLSKISELIDSVAERI